MLGSIVLIAGAVVLVAGMAQAKLSHDSRSDAWECVEGR